MITPGGTATASGLLQSEAARSVLAQLATRTRYVIIDAPSTASGADAQSLATAADAALLVVEAGHAEHAQVADAVTQLKRVGIRLLGTVVVPGDAGPYGLAALSPTEHGGPERVPVAVPSYDTVPWISDRVGPLEAPTAKLDVVRSKAPIPARNSRDDDAAGSGDSAAPAP